MFPSKDLPTMASKEPDRQRIIRQTEEFIASGGNIPVYGIIIRDKDNKVVVSDVEKHSRKHSSSQVKKLADAKRFHV